MKKWDYNQWDKLKNKNNKSQKAFTLIELLVIIAIIWTIILWTNLMSFNNISNKQELDTKIIKISSNIELIRNNSLLWKWIWTNLIVPEKYKIDFSTSWSGIIKTYYYSWAISDYVDYTFYDKEIDFSNKFEKISNIKCLDLKQTTENELTSSETWSIIIEWAKLTLSWSCTSNPLDIDKKILEIEIKRKSDTKKIQINTLNWLIEIKK